MPTLHEVKEALRKRGVDKQLGFLERIHHLPDDWPVKVTKGEGHKYRHTSLTYEFEGHTYRVTTDNWRGYATPDSTGNAGDLRLFVDGEEVILISIFDFGVNSASLKSLKAGEWIDVLPKLVEAIEAGEKERMERWQAEQDAKTMRSIDLGEFKL